ncbi:flagellar hook-basal body complex protein [Heliobacterium gestii]|uniref:Flagellar hook protein FlgE n=1 Tax=Heliomicrobium gestii TaxID=2699 RepID=A0A845L9Y9_HELGE|nr:flagellar hook protein FlgE [Heliomicrobium gestii]MBM7867114.1 flagellar hook protein FlgE [Heliomicrobium gestii]MZP43472.1 flagellar hook-basal body complex protein [Heliomicrobium gestii]
MMRSLFSGVTALRNHQTRMDVIGNNIANVNTIGFKKSRVTFADALNQTTRGAAAPQGGRGGTNPMQVGLGMNIATMETVFTPTSVQGTGKNSDLAVDGDGFFLLNDGGTQYYTRAGNFDLDTEYNFYRTDNGMKVMGYMADASGNIDPSKSPTEINIKDKLQMPALATNRVSFNKNLNSLQASSLPIQKSIEIFDSKGGKHNLLLTMKNVSKAGDENHWIVSARITTEDPTTHKITTATGFIQGEIYFSSNGMFKRFDVTNATDFSFPGLGVNKMTAMPTGSYSAGFTFPSTSNNSAFYLDLHSITQFSSDTTVDKLSQNGYADGALKTYAIDSAGVLTGTFSNGKSLALAQVCVTTFSNPAGLIKAGSNLYMRSNNSGEPNTGQPAVGSRGAITPGALEMSNVDLSQEFTDMITTQRGFQANSRIITVSDSMLEELVNLKR